MEIFFTNLGIFILVVFESLSDFITNIEVGVIGNLGYFIGYAIVSIKLFEKPPHIEEISTPKNHRGM